MPKSMYLLPLLPLLLATTCKKDSPRVFQNLFLEVPLSFRPAKAAMQVGDTLWLEADYSDSLLDIRTSKRFRLRPEDANPRTFVSFFQLTGAPDRQQDFATAFKPVCKIGEIVGLGSTAGLLKPAYVNGRYKLKIGLVALRKGIASITVNLSHDRMSPFRPGSSMPFVDVGNDSEGRKILVELGDIYYVINKGNTNFNLLQQYAKAYSLEPNAPERAVYYEQKSTFNVIIQ